MAHKKKLRNQFTNQVKVQQRLPLSNKILTQIQNKLAYCREKVPKKEEIRFMAVDTRATSLSLFPFMHWRRKWHPTPVFLPGESQGRGSLVGCRLWGRTESDTTEVT